jgi:predicted metal-binding membrane protein
MVLFSSGPDSHHGLTGDFNLAWQMVEGGFVQRPSKYRLDTMKSSVLLEAILRRDRRVVTVALVVVITISWLYLLAGAGTGMYPHEMAALNPSLQGTGPSVSSGVGTSGHNIPMRSGEWTPGYTLLMFAMWWLMMIAMMLPSAAPMVLLHAAVTRNKLPPGNDAMLPASSRQFLQSTTAFVAGYLAVWGAFSLVAIFAQWMLERQALLSPMMTSTSWLLGSGLLLAAGLWQLTPLKTACLRQCRSPISFMSMHWRSGIRGAFGMGIKHGTYCLGCCWFLMALLFYAGVMNLIWISGLAMFILVEKLMPGGDIIGKVIGVLLIVWGAWLGLGAT